MKNLTIVCALLGIINFSTCKEKDPEITKTYELSPEMMDYFVNYTVGTKWIYLDINDTNKFDTIELITKEPFDITDGTTVKKGYVLYYKPSVSKDFKVRVDPGVNNTYYVKVDPLVTAAGAVTFQNNNGTWNTGVNYFDSVDVKGTTFYAVIKSLSHSDFHAFIHIGNKQGIIFFSNMDGNRNLNNFKLITTILP